MTSDLKKTHYIETENLWITPKGRTSFVALSRKFKSQKSTRKDDDGKYAVEITFPRDADIKPLKKAANDALQAKFGNKVDFWTPGKAKGYNNPFLRAEDKLSEVTSKGEPVDLDGLVTIRTTAYKRRPIVRDSKGAEVDVDDLDIEAYSGRWMRLQVRPSGYEQDQGKGVTFYLEGVQLLSHDDKIGGGAAPSSGEAFGAVDDEDEEDV